MYTLKTSYTTKTRSEAKRRVRLSATDSTLCVRRRLSLSRHTCIDSACESSGGARLRSVSLARYNSAIYLYIYIYMRRIYTGIQAREL